MDVAPSILGPFASLTPDVGDGPGGTGHKFPTETGKEVTHMATKKKAAKKAKKAAKKATKKTAKK